MTIKEAIPVLKKHVYWLRGVITTPSDNQKLTEAIDSVLVYFGAKPKRVEPIGAELTEITDSWLLSEGFALELGDLVYRKEDKVLQLVKMQDGYYPICYRIPEQDEPSQPIMFQRLTEKKEVSSLVYLMFGTVIGIE
jgi:hypothetical protein